MRSSGTPRPAGIGTGLTVILAVACGASAANLYYAQPLLSTIAHAFHTGSGQAGLIVTLSQVGYAAGLAFLVPAGDLFSRRRLVPAALVLTAAALVASAVAPSLVVLALIALVVGVGSVAAQILVPLAASLADPDARGRVVGTVMSGLLMGILLARTVAGLVAGVSSWRVVYAAAAVVVLIVAAVLARTLPAESPRPELRYRDLLVSTARLFAAEPVLRRRALLGGLGFAAFSIFWTTMAFLLSGAPYHYSDTVIGLFGLVGAAGALCANAAGKLADKDHTRASTLVFGVAILVSFVPTYLGRDSVLALIVGIVVLDVGVQGLQVTNQSLIYRLAPEARSRITSSYMVCYFAGGAIGSAVAGSVYDVWGWAGVCAVGGAVGLAATAVGIFDMVAPAHPASPPEASEAPRATVASPR
jgi:predicted MFS family arabinose efflux permease